MSSTEPLSSLCNQLAARLASAYPEFEGHRVRVDAGEAGMIYVALRGARGEGALGEALASKLSAAIDAELEGGPGNVAYAISVGSGAKDLLLQLEFRRVG